MGDRHGRKGPATGRPRAQKYTQYSNYFTNNSVLWTNFFSGGLMSGGGPQVLVDEPDETYTEPFAAATQSSR